MKTDLNHFLTLLANGDKSVVDRVLESLAKETLFIGYTKSRESGDTVAFSVPVWVSPRKRVLPAFLVQDEFLRWSKGQHQCLPLAAGDLAAVFPEKTMLVLNPDRLNSVELTGETFRRVMEFDADVRKTGVIMTLQGEARLGETDHLKRVSQMQEELRRTFRHYPEVTEAVYRMPDDHFPGGLLGVITSMMDPERRFFLMSEIGQLSRVYFGTVGAIEVFDDQEIRRATQWQYLTDVKSLYSQKGTERLMQDTLVVPDEPEHSLFAPSAPPSAPPVPEEDDYRPPPAVVGGKVVGQRRDRPSSVRKTARRRRNFLKR